MSNAANPTRAAAITIAASVLLSQLPTVGAQSLMTSSGLVLAASTEATPGAPNTIFPSSTTAWDNPVIDETGNVWFRAQLLDDGTGTSGVATLNNRAYFYGSSRSNLSMVVRASDPAPQLPGLTLNTATGAGTSIGYRISASGHALWGSSLSTGSTADDTVLYAGTPGNWQIVGREGDVVPGAPGVAGCFYASASSFSAPSQTATGFNRNGVVLFKAKLSAGDVIGTTNDDIWYVGAPGALSVMLREGDAVSSVVVGALGSTVNQLNDAGQVLHDVTLSTTVGVTPATAADDRALMLYTPGPGNQIILREGDSAPGTASAQFGHPSNAFSFSSTMVSAADFNANGQSLMGLQLINGDAVAGVNDYGLYVVSAAGHTLVVRRGDAAPSLPGLSMDMASTTAFIGAPGIADNGAISFRGKVAGGSVTTNDDTCIWAGQPGSLVVIAREGDVAPGTGGQLYGDVAATVSPYMNANGVVLFQNRMGGTNDALFLYDTNAGGAPQLVVMAGDVVEVLPGVFKTVSGFGAVQAGNSSGGTLMFSNDNSVALRLSMTDNTQAIVRIPGVQQPSAYCTAGTTTHGCVPAIGWSGTASATAPSGFDITVANVEGQKQGLIFYGITAQHAAPWGSGSSFLCVKAPTQRTAVQSSGGTVDLCDGALALDWNAFVFNNLGVLGTPFVGGETVYAQGWFRDPPASKTTNLSNALQFVVQP